MSVCRYGQSILILPAQSRLISSLPNDSEHVDITALICALNLHNTFPAVYRRWQSLSATPQNVGVTDDHMIVDLLVLQDALLCCDSELFHTLLKAWLGRLYRISSGLGQFSSTASSLQTYAQAHFSDTLQNIRHQRASIDTMEAKYLIWLCKFGLVPNSYIDHNDTALTFVLRHGFHDEIVVNVCRAQPQLVAMQARTSAETPLFSAIHHGRADLAVWLLNSFDDLNVDANTPDGKTALILAAHDGQAGVVQRLLDHAADANATFRGRTALQWAQDSSNKVSGDYVIDKQFYGEGHPTVVETGKRAARLESVVELLSRVVL